jgi:hypothetical protein
MIPVPEPPAVRVAVVSVVSGMLSAAAIEDSSISARLRV